jgi:hypothetical protein
MATPPHNVSSFGVSTEHDETEAQLRDRVRGLVARNMADRRPSLSSTQASAYLDARLDELRKKPAAGRRPGPSH